VELYAVMDSCQRIAKDFVSLLVLLAVAGCSGAPDDRPPLGEVTGLVTLDGKPLPDAYIIFRPQSGGASSEAVTDGQGRYELSYLRDVKGAKVDTHLVRISTYREPETTDEGKTIGGSPEKLPAKYNTKSELTREVKAGKNPIDFKLDSQGEITDPSKDDDESEEDPA
jgi:hypothetical protein